MITMVKPMTVLSPNVLMIGIPLAVLFLSILIVGIVFASKKNSKPVAVKPEDEALPTLSNAQQLDQAFDDYQKRVLETFEREIQTLTSSSDGPQSHAENDLQRALAIVLSKKIEKNFRLFD